jgi:hypothetical protein
VICQIDACEGGQEVGGAGRFRTGNGVLEEESIGQKVSTGSSDLSDSLAVLRWGKGERGRVDGTCRQMDDNLLS